MNNIPRRKMLQQMAALPFVAGLSSISLRGNSVMPPPSPLTQLNILIHGLAIIVVYKTPKPRLEILFPNVPSSSSTDGHRYRAGNFLGTTDNDLTDAADLDAGEIYSLEGIVAGTAVPQFETDRNLLFSAQQSNIYIDPDKLSFCRLILPFPSVVAPFSYRPAIRCKKNAGGTCIPTANDPFVTGTAMNLGSSLKVGLVHIFSYTIADINRLQLHSISCNPPVNWKPARKTRVPNSSTVNLLFYAEPDIISSGDHASHAFELLTDLLPVKQSARKLDIRFNTVESDGIQISDDNTLPDNVDPTKELATLIERKTAGLAPANCVGVVITP